MTIHSLYTPSMRRIKKIHFVGIGGAGMGGIAEVLHNQGYRITGSDSADNSMTQRLRSLGVTIYPTHSANNIHSVDVVVRSTAIPDSNPEILAARQAHIPIVPRAQMLGELMRFRQGIAVAGTHGKTTTTSLVSSILAEGGLDPTFVIGGLLNSAGTNARLGTSPYLVAEADESDASFLYLHPLMAIVTNIDADHMSTYDGDFNKLKRTFLDFLHQLPFYGLAILCHDDEETCSIIPELSRPVLTYGIQQGADIQATDIRSEGFKTLFTVHRPNCQPLDVQLNLPGNHNVLNALAAIAVATEVGVSDAAITKALAQFAGVGRRLQQLGEIEFSPGKKTLIIDDYGHHPREISATLQAVRQAWPHRRIVMAYQPHRYSRTRDLFNDFTDVLSKVDQLLLLEVYPAGETPIAGADSSALCQAIKQQGKMDPTHVKDKQRLIDTLRHVLQHDDILLMQGAGNIGAMAASLPATLAL